MENSNIVSIRRLEQNTMYQFNFTVNSISSDSVCKMDLPTDFRFMPKAESEMITSLLMSYFFSAEIFVKSQEAKALNNLGFVPRELLGETVTLIVFKNKSTGFTFQHHVPDSIKGNAGEMAIADSITNLLLEYEESLSISGEDTENKIV